MATLRVWAVTLGAGDAGGIALTTPLLRLDGGTITASTGYGKGNGGNITLAGGYFLKSADSRIDASSRQGLDGQDVIDSPNEITGTVAVLDVPLLDISEILRERCSANVLRERSSFTIEGRGGLPLRPGDLLSSSLPEDESGRRKSPSAVSNSESKSPKAPSTSKSGRKSRETKQDPRICVGCALALMLASAATVVAQKPERKVEVRPSEERKRVLDEMPTRPIDTTPVLPPAELLYTRGLGPVERIRVERIVLEGVTVLANAEVAKMVAPYEGREVSIEELQELRRQSSEEYIRRGYVNSGVVIPYQEVVQGVVAMREVAGKLTKIEARGNGHLSKGYISKRIDAAAAEPLGIQDLPKALELLQQDPLIQRINARLVPGLNLGEAELEVTLKRSQPFQVVVGADNQRSASTGGEQGTLSLAHLNLTGHGDVISADLGVSEGRTMGWLLYSYPLTARNTKIQASFSLDDGGIVEEPFDKIDIKSKTARAALFVSHPIIQELTQALVSLIGFERKHSESTLLGVPFSFSLGDREGKSDTAVVNFGIEWTRRSRSQVFAFRGTIRRGINAFNATINEEGPDGRFTAFLGQLQYARRAGPLQSELLLRGAAQLAAEPLLGLEGSLRRV